MAGPWEVEQKYIVTDTDQLLDRLSQQSAIELPTEVHVDIYLAHPCRDFRATDEAFRLRRFNSDACVTYKGKRLPGNVKTRQEIELPIRHVDIPQWLEMMQSLGFQSKPEVRKIRRIFSLATVEELADPPFFGPFVVAIDDVTELGTFAEIELIVDEKERLDEARHRIELVAGLLGLTQVQPRSYLSLLLAKRGDD